MSNRDTQFQGFAKALADEITNVHDGLFDYSDWWKEQVQGIIARRAYDLVEHTIDQITPTIRELWTDRELLELIPDMTDLPKEQE